MLALLGTNAYRNDWNHIYNEAGVHAWVGKLASGEVATVQVGPWEKQAWGCGSGNRGSCNNGWIQFEICEDALTDKTYFEQVYREAVELTAYLCKTYGLDPLGTVAYNGVTVPVILCHQDSYWLGLGSNHEDVLHWFPKFGKSMQDVRNDVAALVNGSGTTTETEDDDMDLKRFKELMGEYRGELQDNDCGTWSQAARDWAVGTGLIVGSGGTINGELNCMWQDLMTREQMVTVMYRFAQLMGKV